MTQTLLLYAITNEKTVKLTLFFLIKWLLTATSGTKPIIVSAGHVYILLHQREKRGSTVQYGYRKL